MECRFESYWAHQPPTVRTPSPDMSEQGVRCVSPTGSDHGAWSPSGPSKRPRCAAPRRKAMDARPDRGERPPMRALGQKPRIGGALPGTNRALARPRRTVAHPGPLAAGYALLAVAQGASEGLRRRPHPPRRRSCLPSRSPRTASCRARHRHHPWRGAPCGCPAPPRRRAPSPGCCRRCGWSRGGGPPRSSCGRP